MLDLRSVLGDQIAVQNSADGSYSLVSLDDFGYGPGVDLPNGDTWLVHTGRSLVAILTGGVLSTLAFSFDSPEAIAHDAATDRVYIGHHGGIEAFSPAKVHLGTVPQAPFRYATCLAVSPSGATLYATYGARDIVAIDIATGVASTFHDEPPLVNADTGTPEFFGFYNLGIHPSGTVWTFASTYAGRERMWLFRFASDGRVLERTPFMESTVDASYHDHFNSVWDFDLGVGYWSKYGDDLVGRYKPVSGTVVADLFPDSAAAYDAAGGSGYLDRPYWFFQWGIRRPSTCPPRLVATARTTDLRLRVNP